MNGPTQTNTQLERDVVPNTKERRERVLNTHLHGKDLPTLMQIHKWNISRIYISAKGPLHCTIVKGGPPQGIIYKGRTSPIHIHEGGPPNTHLWRGGPPQGITYKGTQYIFMKGGLTLYTSIHHFWREDVPKTQSMKGRPPYPMRYVYMWCSFEVSWTH